MPSPLTDEEGDFILIHHEDLQLSQKAEEVYAQLHKMLLEQHEVSCLLASLPFRGNSLPLGKGMRLRPEAWLQILALPLPGCLTWHKALPLSEPHFHL